MMETEERFKQRLTYINIRITVLAKRGDYEGDPACDYYRTLVLHRAMIVLNRMIGR